MVKEIFLTNIPYAQKATKDFYNRFMKGELSRKSAGWVDSTDFETDGF